MDSRITLSPCPFCGHHEEFLTRTGKRICTKRKRTRGYKQLIKPIQGEQNNGLENNLQAEEPEKDENRGGKGADAAKHSNFKKACRLPCFFVKKSGLVFAKSAKFF